VQAKDICEYVEQHGVSDLKRGYL